MSRLAITNADSIWEGGRAVLLFTESQSINRKDNNDVDYRWLLSTSRRTPERKAKAAHSSDTPLPSSSL
jgi:hypothetical protein